MKVKQLPGDFQVEELTAVRPGKEGDYSFYRLDKVGWTTPDAMQIVRNRWKLDGSRISFGGLKDRHAETTQFFTAFRGPRRNLSQAGITVTHLGQVTEPYISQHISANRFHVTIRHLTLTQVSTAMDAVKTVSELGFPNYFDDQRFGSVGHDNKLVGRELVHGRFEEALKIALTSPYAYDRSAQKKEKDTLLKLWGNWTACRSALPRGHTRYLIEYLVNRPTDHRGAIARLRPELSGMYLAAYQSHLWNRTLDRWLRYVFPLDSLMEVALRLGDFTVPVRASDELHTRWRSLILPLPSSRQKPVPGSEWNRVLEEVLSEEGLSLAMLKVPGLRKPFFSKGERAACVYAHQVRTETTDDDLNPGSRKLQLSFELPRGSYATMYVKRIMETHPVCRPPGP